ncbi:hypothetical protein EVAR_63780_1 [Eumeta japonica]|uniref:Uncharacterized protein n=1 Tax=Eumeta variegata TaxID=151549 RepID=A0A4C1ZE54_EUMVA|nr:hypothetical protein EVAR_63780_1 [Eumeta japonica]
MICSCVLRENPDKPKICICEPNKCLPCLMVTISPAPWRRARRAEGGCTAEAVCPSRGFCICVMRRDTRYTGDTRWAGPIERDARPAMIMMLLLHSRYVPPHL